MASFDKKKGRLILSTGKSLRCLGNMMCPGNEGLEYGSDGNVDTDDLTHEERKEIAGYFIAKWNRWLDEMPETTDRIDWTSIGALNSLEILVRNRRIKLEEERDRALHTKELDENPDKVVNWLGDIGSFCEELVFHAKRLNRKITGEFNGKILVAEPDSSPLALYTEYMRERGAVSHASLFEKVPRTS